MEGKITIKETSHIIFRIPESNPLEFGFVYLPILLSISNTKWFEKGWNQPPNCHHSNLFIFFNLTTSVKLLVYHLQSLVIKNTKKGQFNGVHHQRAYNLNNLKYTDFYHADIHAVRYLKNYAAIWRRKLYLKKEKNVNMYFMEKDKTTTWKKQDCHRNQRSIKIRPTRWHGMNTTNEKFLSMLEQFY